MPIVRAHLLVRLALLFAAAPAVARGDDIPAAREHYQRGTRHFDLGHYRDAAHEFELAYQAKDDPALLYNIAQAYRLAGDSAEAVGVYRSFLRRMPRAPNRAEVQERIDELELLLAQQAKTRRGGSADTMRPAPMPAGAASPTPADPSPATTSAPPSASAGAPPRLARPGSGRRVAGLAIAGVGIGAAIAGAVLGGLALSASDQLSRPAPGQVFDPGLESSGRAYQAASIGLLAGGIAALGVGTTLFVLGLRADRSAARLSLGLQVGEGRFAGAVQGSF